MSKPFQVSSKMTRGKISEIEDPSCLSASKELATTFKDICNSAILTLFPICFCPCTTSNFKRHLNATHT